MTHENPPAERRTSSDGAQLVDVFESDPASDHSDYAGLVVLLIAVVGSAALVTLLGLLVD
jgi:hypothetical protein